MVECPTLVNHCHTLSKSACGTLCKMCEMSCGMCDPTTTVEPTFETTTMIQFGQPFARAAQLDEEKDEMKKCHQQQIEDPTVNCTKNGMFEPLQCVPLEAKTEKTDSAWELRICFCVDTESGVKIPLTEKAVLGNQDYGVDVSLIKIIIKFTGDSFVI